MTTSVLEDSLYTRSCPPMDVLIRTSGEIRLSDFMLWQSSRACHIEFTDCYWPEFTFWKLVPILLRYQLRAGSIAQSRREYERRDEISEDTEEESPQEEPTAGMGLGNSSESTLVTVEDRDRDVDWYDCQKEKRRRVAEFLTHRGHLPNCPLVQLQ